MSIIDKPTLYFKNHGHDEFYEALRTKAIRRGDAFVMPPLQEFYDYWAIEMPEAAIDASIESPAELARTPIEIFLVGRPMKPEVRQRLYQHKPSALFAIYLALNVYAKLKETHGREPAYPIEFLKVIKSENEPRMRELFSGRCVLILDDWTTFELQSHLIHGAHSSFWHQIVELYDRYVVRNIRIESRLKHIQVKSRTRLANEYIFRPDKDDSIPLTQIISMLRSRHKIPADLARRIVTLAESGNA